jgi:hypothetical protein
MAYACSHKKLMDYLKKKPVNSTKQYLDFRNH